MNQLASRVPRLGRHPVCVLFVAPVHFFSRVYTSILTHIRTETTVFILKSLMFLE